MIVVNFDPVDNNIFVLVERTIEVNFGSVSNAPSLPLLPKTGNTIVFDGQWEHNAASPLTSGDIIIDPTAAIAGAINVVYFNGATEPSISGAPGRLESGTFVANELNIYYFYWNTVGEYVLNIQNTGTPAVPQLSAPTVIAVAGDTLVDLTFSNIDANATSNVLDRSEDNVIWANVAGYNGTDLTYQDTGLTNGQIYYYRLKSQAAGYTDSNYGTDDATPSAIPQLTTPTVVAAAGDTLIDLTFSNIDANATSNVLDRSEDNVIWANVAGYNGTDLTYQDTGLTNTQIYYYRLKSQAAGYTDSNYGTDNATPAAAGAFLLDTYTGSVTAYSLEKLKTGIVIPVRIRRADNGDKGDVLFDGSNTISGASIMTNTDNGGDGQTLTVWMGSADIRIQILYDQSGNAENINNTTTTLQPYLAKAGVLNTVNGKVAWDYTVDTNIKLTTAGAIACMAGGVACSAFTVGQANNAEDNGCDFSNSVSSLSLWRGFHDSRAAEGRLNRINSSGGTFDADLSTGDTNVNQRLYTRFKDTATLSSYYNGTAQVLSTAYTDTFDNDELVLGFSSSSDFNGKHQLFLLFPTIRADRASIESDINTLFTIY